jgi:hypothetical protein
MNTDTEFLKNALLLAHGLFYPVQKVKPIINQSNGQSYDKIILNNKNILKTETEEEEEEEKKEEEDEEDEEEEEDEEDEEEDDDDYQWKIENPNFEKTLYLDVSGNRINKKN